MTTTSRKNRREPAETIADFERALRRALQQKVKTGGRYAYIRSLLRRDRNGKLLFPRTVYAHLDDIDALAPDQLSEEERRDLAALHFPF